MAKNNRPGPGGGEGQQQGEGAGNRLGEHQCPGVAPTAAEARREQGAQDAAETGTHREQSHGAGTDPDRPHEEDDLHGLVAHQQQVEARAVDDDGPQMRVTAQEAQPLPHLADQGGRDAGLTRGLLLPRADTEQARRGDEEGERVQQESRRRAGRLCREARRASARHPGSAGSPAVPTHPGGAAFRTQAPPPGRGHATVPAGLRRGTRSGIGAGTVACGRLLRSAPDERADVGSEGAHALPCLVPCAGLEPPFLGGCPVADHPPQLDVATGAVLR